MAYISRSVPLKAYDHIADLLRDSAGKDGVISKKDAKALVAQLRKEGRGTEAVAAENIFKMVDRFNDESGQRVTGYDLDLTRKYVQESMLENRDKNKNGYTKGEIAKMSPTGRALVELGQVLELEQAKGRVSHAVPQRGLAHIVGLLAGAMGKDSVLSRKDIDALQKSLYEAGRGTESLAVGYFAGFIDHRDHKPGARITKDDLERAMKYAEESLLKNKDKAPKNGYSKKEIAEFSTSAKAFLMLGQMLDAGIIR